MKDLIKKVVIAVVFSLVTIAACREAFVYTELALTQQEAIAKVESIKHIPGKRLMTFRYTSEYDGQEHTCYQFVYQKDLSIFEAGSEVAVLYGKMFPERAELKYKALNSTLAMSLALAVLLLILYADWRMLVIMRRVKPARA